MMFDKPLVQVTADDLNQLVTNKVREGIGIDYKLTVPGNSDQEKKDFLADVSSFANSSGGLIVFGIREERDASNQQTGIPEKIEGIPGLNADQEELRLTQLIRTSIDPRIPGIEVRTIGSFNSGPALVIRIPRSFALPHVVSFRDSCRFYARTSAGRHLLDVREICSLVLQSSALPEKIRNFRAERLAKISSRQTPVPIRGNPTHILHIVPLSIFSGTHPFDISGIHIGEGDLWPPGINSCGTRFNLDGILRASSNRSEPAVSYIQVFRNGVLEIVTSREEWIKDNVHYIPSVGYERYTIEDTQRAIKFLEKQLIPPSTLIFPSIIGVKDAVLITCNNERGIDEKYIFGEENLLLPDITINDYSDDIGKVLRPAFDFLWQAGGFRRSNSYRPDGSWQPR